MSILSRMAEKLRTSVQLDVKAILLAPNAYEQWHQLLTPLDRSGIATYQGIRVVRINYEDLDYIGVML